MENHRASNVVLLRIGEAQAHSRSMNALEVKIQISSAMDEALKACPSGDVENKYIILYTSIYIYIILYRCVYIISKRKVWEEMQHALICLFLCYAVI